MKIQTKRRVYLREAALMLTLARLVIFLFPPAHIFAWLKRPLRRVNRFAANEISWVSWAIESRGQKSKIACLPRALAAHLMLRRRGIPSEVCLGVTREAGQLAAHAWLKTDNETVMGGEEAHRFVQLARFGGPPD